jgi:uncharacterized protein involved in exopolysaccharide biosynthesis
MDGQEFQPGANGTDRLPTLRDIATPLFRHPRLVAWTFAGLLLATALGTILFPKTNYEAQMKILVKRERVDAAVSPGRDAVMSNSGGVTEEEINSEVELLKSRDLLEKVVVSCDLQDSLSRHFWTWLLPASAADKSGTAEDNEKKISQAVVALEEKLQVEPLKKTNLIQVTFDSPDPQLAARVLRTLSNLYLEKTVAVHRPPGAFEFFQAESQHYDQELQAAQSQLAKFDLEKGVADPQLEKQIALQKLSEFEATYNATQVAIKEAEKRTRVVEDQLASTPAQTVSQVRSLPNAYLMQQLKSTLLELELKRTALLGTFKPDYRPVQEVQKQIEETKETIAKAEKSPDREETTDRNPSYEWLQAELTKSNAELASLQARAAETQGVIRKYRERLAEIDVNGAAQDNLVREVKEAEGNDLLYKQKREEARIGDALDRQRIVNVAIAEAATVPALPARPHWALTLLFGTLLACLASPGVAFVVDYFDPSLRTPDELRDVLQIPVLAALPREKAKTHVS